MELHELKADAIDIEGLDRAALEVMLAAGEDVIECHRVLANTQDNIVGELLRDQGTFYEWNHFPDGDVYDPNSHAQYYYHAHPKGSRFEEHGHFHTFVRGRGMPSDVKPLPVPDFVNPEDENDLLSHLIAISMDPKGLAQGLFTTNRWVTGEIWYAAGDVCRLLDRFLIDHTRPSWPVNRWISGIIRLFRPQMAALIEARDRTVQRWQDDHPGENVFEDRELEVTSFMAIDVDAQIGRVIAALNRAS